MLRFASEPDKEIVIHDEILPFESRVILWLGSPLLALAQMANQPPARPDYSKEAFVLEQSSDKFKLQNDGTSSRELIMQARVQSDAGVQQLGVLKFSYLSSSESFAVDYVRVRKPDGSLVVSPPDNFQDMPADVIRAAPFYSDIQEKHVAVKGWARVMSWNTRYIGSATTSRPRTVLAAIQLRPRRDCAGRGSSGERTP